MTLVDIIKTHNLSNGPCKFLVLYLNDHDLIHLMQCCTYLYTSEYQRLSLSHSRYSGNYIAELRVQHKIRKIYWDFPLEKIWLKPLTSRNLFSNPCPNHREWNTFSQKVWSNVTDVKVSSNVVGFIISLSNETRLKCINFSNNRLKIYQFPPVNLYGRLTHYLMHNVHIQSLFLNRCDIGNYEVSLLAAALQINYSLIDLHLGHNNITDEGGVSLASALIHNSTLKAFYLNVCQISDQGATRFAQALLVNSTLHFIQLENNLITDIGGDALFQTCLCNKYLHVSVQDCALSQCGHNIKEKKKGIDFSYHSPSFLLPMGSPFSTPFMSDLDPFWDEWYKTTHDYSVGPSTSWHNDRHARDTAKVILLRLRQGKSISEINRIMQNDRWTR